MRICGLHRRSGFTLIELLVVIAIIAILAAILFPVFVKARDQGKLAKCMSNLKQCGVAVFMYCDDNNAYFPPGLILDSTGKPLVARGAVRGRKLWNFAAWRCLRRTEIQLPSAPAAEQIC